ncbi:hypothetical protein C4K00_4378 [Pseudomonas synxantha]|uniref:hypothetical protein n=1 Tax=Pseudomonas synxantha TaxID=47883 RepID=UPI000F55D953|nr:hypothetical protein [Pseudomonas synxantha]AZE74580.1 hypothetical protein C4K00_4378 [Pseudomonas synxantha]AZE80181.1 hypothetical protein C4J99_4423 [Pseudomonas synxantha]
MSKDDEKIPGPAPVIKKPDEDAVISNPVTISGLDPNGGTVGIYKQGPDGYLVEIGRAIGATWSLTTTLAVGVYKIQATSIIPGYSYYSPVRTFTVR